MNQYNFVYGQLFDPMLPEVVGEFEHTIIAKNLFDAVDKFYEMFSQNEYVIINYSSKYV